MAKLIALEWDSREIRIAVGSPRGSDINVDEAFAVPLSADGEQGPSTTDVSEQLAAVLQEKGLTGCDALVALPRSNIELRGLTLPPAPPEEIPDMVRFQAMQAFTSIGEDWPLDYVELDSDENGIHVLASVVSPKLVEQIHQIAEGSELHTQCLVLRPFAAVSLLHRYEPVDVYRSSLIVDVLPGGADLTAIAEGKVVFMRSVRLPSGVDDAARAGALVGELRRTIGAAQNQMGGSRIEQIVICGNDSEQSVLRATLAEKLDLDIAMFDPFAAIRTSRKLAGDLPEDSGRFAPLLGMLSCQATGVGHTIDFFSPRRRPEPPSKKGRNIAIAACAALVVAIGAFLFFNKKAELDAEIARLQDQSTSLDQAVDKARGLIARVDQLEGFEQGDITWLDELKEVSRRLPPPDDVILREIRLGIDPAGKGGRLTLKGNVARSDVIAELEEAMRYGENRVKGYYGAIDPSEKKYPYQIETTVYVPPDILENGHSQGRPHLAQNSSPPEASNQPRAPQAEERKPSPPGDAGTEDRAAAASGDTRPSTTQIEATVSGEPGNETRLETSDGAPSPSGPNQEADSENSPAREPAAATGDASESEATESTATESEATEVDGKPPEGPKNGAEAAPPSESESGEDASGGATS